MIPFTSFDKVTYWYRPHLLIGFKHITLVVLPENNSAVTVPGMCCKLYRIALTGAQRLKNDVTILKGILSVGISSLLLIATHAGR